MSDVIIYTDGSCSPKDRSGGYGAILIMDGREKIITGYESDTTNQRMELMGAIRGLAALRRIKRKKGRRIDLRWNVKLYTDSAYVVNAFRCNWIENWRRNGWRNYRNKPVANRELWETLDALAAHHHVEFIHVKGHAGNVLNERADRMASEARKAGIGAN